MRLKLYLLFFLLFANSNFAQFPVSDASKITLLTCGPGEELYSTFGHTAIRVNDPAINLDLVYNFGTFDFATPNFYLKFVKGDLQYYVSVASYNEFIYEYNYMGRAVYEQELLLTNAQKKNIANELNDILLSDRKFYTYKFIDRNCTTMVADIIAANIQGGISEETSDKGKTNREIIYSYLDNHFYENLGINLMFGYKTDKISDKLFLPQELLEGVANTKINGQPLAKPPVTVNQGADVQAPFSFWNSFYSFAIAVAILMLLSRYALIRHTIMAFTGLVGVFFCFVGFYSYHSEILLNYNALLINPLYLVLTVTLMFNLKSASRITTYLLFGCMAIYIILMLNKPHLFIVLPLIVLYAVLLLRGLRRVSMAK